MMNNFSELTKTAIEAALKSGQIVKEGFLRPLHDIKDKGQGVQNIVTEYDLLSEKTIVEYIKKKYPSHAIWGEEGGKSSGSNILWIIDPIDGTVNFAHKVPHFCISIAAKNEELLTGVVYQPITGELFVAEKDKGAFLNDQRLKVSSAATFDRALISMDFPYNLKDNPLNCIDRLAKIARTGMPIRTYGAAALGLAFLAAGRVDAFWEPALMPWDFAAGKLLVEESGGRVTSIFGTEIEFKENASLLATNFKLHNLMLEVLK